MQLPMSVNVDKRFSIPCNWNGMRPYHRFQDFDYQVVLEDYYCIFAKRLIYNTKAKSNM